MIKNTRVLDITTGEVAIGDVAIADGLIVGAYESYTGAREVDGHGLMAVPPASSIPTSTLRAT